MKKSAPIRYMKRRPRDSNGKLINRRLLSTTTNIFARSQKSFMAVGRSYVTHLRQEAHLSCPWSRFGAFFRFESCYFIAHGTKLGELITSHNSGPSFAFMLAIEQALAEMIIKQFGQSLRLRCRPLRVT
jgi:hypothetical protein